MGAIAKQSVASSTIGTDYVMRLGGGLQWLD